jgi:hypothetical protein
MLLLAMAVNVEFGIITNYHKLCKDIEIEKAYQLLAHGRWFSPGTPASSTTKTGRHEITEILLKVSLKHQKSNLMFCTQHYKHPLGVEKRIG